MPEGHTIHRLARDLNRSFKGGAVQASSPQGRFKAGAEQLDRQVCHGFDAYGKHLVGHFDGGDVLHVHLGLIGKFRRAKGDPVGQVRLRLSVDETHWDLRGPMVCTVGSPELADDVASSVGPDPLRRGTDPSVFFEAMSRRRIPVAAALLDQKVIAGIGNVYRAELLFVAGIDPLTPSNKIEPGTLEALWDLTVAQLRLGEKLDRIVTVDPDQAGYAAARKIPDGERLYVYKRGGDPCRVCATSIETLEVGARKTWRCRRCQR